MPTYCLSALDHFAGLALKGLGFRGALRGAKKLLLDVWLGAEEISAVSFKTPNKRWLDDSILVSNIFRTFAKRSYWKNRGSVVTQPVITCSKIIIETLEQGVKYVQS